MYCDLDEASWVTDNGTAFLCQWSPGHTANSAHLNVARCLRNWHSFTPTFRAQAAHHLVLWSQLFFFIRNIHSKGSELLAQRFILRNFLLHSLERSIALWLFRSITFYHGESVNCGVDEKYQKPRSCNLYWGSSPPKRILKKRKKIVLNICFMTIIKFCYISKYI